MTSACPESSVWSQLADRQLSEEQAQSLRAHARSCARCQHELRETEALLARIAAPLEPATPTDEAVARIMRRVREVPERPRARTRWSQPWAAGAIAAALAAGLAVFILRPVPGSHPGAETFTSRGGSTAPSPGRDVGITFHTPATGTAPLAAGGVVPADSGFGVRYRNLDTREPVYLLAFAQDARGEVHWLYPAHLRDDANEPSVRLEPSAEPRALNEVVVLDEPAQGPLRLVSVVTREPLGVRDIESLAPEERAPEALRKRWPESSVESVSVVLAGPGAHP
ncbi:zf-HC2 domain-containing protein [Pyxidicoccus parkwayensis]|uniref:Zf-HC2 domain-containing protein n=1 Tax=Pyxidicoccus parkwayensis TaxID=2813578 RepID=A0ABX7P1S5_9BACT|nr:zf-HC2 domain-containing protein [Pyxidicoccus parkwaysis]QSQ23974.1 zf-HC2 domain-containing protein [Pyxidicoccus parkwaysis]